MLVLAFCKKAFDAKMHFCNALKKKDAKTFFLHHKGAKCSATQLSQAMVKMFKKRLILLFVLQNISKNLDSIANNERVFIV